MTGAELSLLSAAAFLTAVLSAIVGMAGGMTLLVVMLLFLDPLVAIPLHGVVQLVSNGTRVTIQRAHVRWEVPARYALLLLPAGLLGVHLAQDAPKEALRVAIGVFVLLATWTPGLFLWPLRRFGGAAGARSAGDGADASAGVAGAPVALPTWRFVILGGVMGALNVTVGATGTLLSPFFLNLGLTRHEVIGTKAACQTIGHLVKIGVFGAVGFAFLEHAPLLAAMSLAVVGGSWVGSRILEKVAEVWFVLLYKAVLTALALRLALVDGWRLLS